jgi:diacylglycerol O-acyltransferase
MNAVVSNVPMAPIPLYCAGARIDQVFPLSVLGPSQGVNITVVSYAGELHFGIVYDPEILESGWEIADSIPKHLVALQASIASRFRDDLHKAPVTSASAGPT